MVVFVVVFVRNAFVCNLEYLHPCSTEALSRIHSQSPRPSHSYHLYHSYHLGFAPNSLTVYPQDLFLLVRAHKPVILFETLPIPFELSSIFLLAVCSVAIGLVHANVNLFLF